MGEVQGCTSQNRQEVQSYLKTGAGSAAGGGAFPLPLPIQSSAQPLMLAKPTITNAAIIILLIGQFPFL